MSSSPRVSSPQHPRASPRMAVGRGGPQYEAVPTADVDSDSDAEPVQAPKRSGIASLPRAGGAGGGLRGLGGAKGSTATAPSTVATAPPPRPAVTAPQQVAKQQAMSDGWDVEYNDDDDDDDVDVGDSRGGGASAAAAPTTQKQPQRPMATKLPTTPGRDGWDWGTDEDYESV